ncbi:MAG: suppressor of fused domain protein [Myxococcota bacterium]
MQDGGHHGEGGPASRPPPPQATSRDVAPGIAAIATRFARLYGQLGDHAHWEAQNPLRDGGVDALEGVSAFEATGHWHYISYGLTELFDTDARFFQPQPGKSGWGFELTFRLARGTETSPPSWPVGMMQRLARYVFRSSNVFRPGDHMDLNGPMGGIRTHTLTGALFTQDPEVPRADTRFGEVSFLQIVGVSADELEAVKDWRCDGFIELLARQDSRLVTAPARRSHLQDATFAAICREGARQEGSSHGSSFASVVRWETEERQLDIVMGAIAVPDIQRMLTLRLPYNRPFRLHGRGASVHFVPGLGAGWQEEGSDLVVSVPWDAASALARRLRPERGTYSWPGMPGIRVVIEPTEVRGSGGEVLRVIG